MPRADCIALALVLGLAVALVPTWSHAAPEDDLKQQLVAAAARSQDNEERVSQIETKLLSLSRREADMSAALLGRRAAQTAALGALMRISRQPPQALIATPAAIDDTIRTSLLLGSTASRLGAEARELGAALEALNLIQRQIASRRMEFEEATTGLAQERERLEALYSLAVVDRAAADEQRQMMTARAAQHAKDLESFLDQLAWAAPEPPQVKPLGDVDVQVPVPQSTTPERPGAPISAARGSLPMPARGRLVALFGNDVNGVKSKGITIETRDDAQVITPYDGEVVYAGPYRGYGRLLIM